MLSCFKQLSSNFTLYLLPIYLNTGARLLLDVVEGLIISPDNPLDVNFEIRSVSPIFLKYLYIG